MARRFHQAQPQNQTKVAAAIHKLEERIMSALSDLQAQVAQTKAGEASAAAAFLGIAAKLQAAIDNDDDAALQELTTTLKDSAGVLAKAVIVVPGTPAAATAEVAAPVAPPTDAAPAVADQAAKTDSAATDPTAQV